MPGDAMRLDYSYRQNGTRGLVHKLSVSRAPSDGKLFPGTAEPIAGLFQPEFTALTDIKLQPDHNERHRLVRDALCDAGCSLGI
jgi:hypothetical protein